MLLFIRNYYLTEKKEPMKITKNYEQFIVDFQKDFHETTASIQINNTKQKPIHILYLLNCNGWDELLEISIHINKKDIQNIIHYNITHL